MTSLISALMGPRKLGGSQEGGGSQPQNLRVLVVEDEAFVAMDLRSTLEQAGLEVVGIGDDFDSAVALFTRHQPDLVLLDINILGTRNGFETAIHLQSLRAVPVVFLTAYDDAATRAAAQEASPYGYLVKPVDTSTLLTTVEVAFERFRSTAGIETLAVGLSHAPVAVVLGDATREGSPIVYANVAWESFTGMSVADSIGRPLCFVAADSTDPGVIEVRDAIRNKIELTRLIRMPDPTGRLRGFEVTHRLMRSGGSGDQEVQILYLADQSRLISYEKVMAQGQAALAKARGAGPTLALMQDEITAFKLDLEADGIDVDSARHKSLTALLEQCSGLERQLRGVGVDMAPAVSSVVMGINLADVVRTLIPLIQDHIYDGVEFIWLVNNPYIPVNLDEDTITRSVLAAIDSLYEEPESMKRLELSLDLVRAVDGGVEASEADSGFAEISIVATSRRGESGEGTDGASPHLPPTDSFLPPRGLMGAYSARTNMRRHGGDLSIEVGPERSLAKIRFPLAEFAERADTMNPGLGAAESIQGMRIYLVMPSVLLREVCCRLLRREGAVVVSAGSEADLLSQHHHLQSPDLLIMDSQLGAGVLRQLGRRFADDDSPPGVVVIAGSYGSIRGFPTTPRWITRKPLDPQRLVRMAREHAAEARSHREDEAGLLKLRPVVENIHPLRVPRPEIPESDDHRLFSSALADVYMVFQPIVDAGSSAIFGFEALLRSRHSKLSGPAEFLAEAERLGRLGDLGRRVHACVAEVIRAHPDRTEVIFVNLHPADLADPDFLLEESPLKAFAHRVAFEITERARMHESAELAETIARLRASDYRVAIDDLGEGYAGLSWLTRLRPDIAKLDMSLVRGIHKHRFKQEVISALNSVCAIGNKTLVVAEGVEDVDEAETLRTLGCDLLQGYYFARPGLPFPRVSPEVAGGRPDAAEPVS